MASYFLYTAAFLSFFANKVIGEEVCYGDLGCFDDVTCHAHGFPPDTPEEVATRFYLFTRFNKDSPQELIRGDVDGLRASNFNANRKTKFSVHGWGGFGLSSGERDRKDAFLEVEDANVILVDWNASKGYRKSHQNARVAGREIGLLLSFLNLEKGLYFKDVHIIGMSLGGHVIGYAGEAQPGIGRVTGLDPAGPLFRDEYDERRQNGPQCRLDPTDGLFVDVIHTDGNDITGLGQMLQMGHQDFYPNGGRHQTGCDDGPDLATSCSHMRAFYFFNESIRPSTCSFTAYSCSSWAEFAQGGCRDCGPSGCAIMGYHADQNKDVQGEFFLETNGASPYCKAA